MIEATITTLNLRRLRYLMLAVFVIESAFLLYVERVRLFDEVHELVVVSYALHSLLALFSVTIFLLLFLGRNKPIKRNSFLHRLPLLATLIVLMFSAVIAFFDQLTHGHITLFSVHLLAFGLLLYLKPSRSFFIFAMPFVVFVVGVSVFQESQDILLTHLINGSIIFAGVLFSSRHFYHHLIKEITYQETLKAKNKELQILSTIDPLTELPNRRHFQRQVLYEIAINKRYNQIASLLLIDIDHFKEVNDTYGHDAGDLILNGLGKIFKSSVRESDTVCRWGGEEFMILLSHTEVDGAVILAKRIRQMVQETTFSHDNHALKITVSIGVTKLDHEAKDGFKESYKQADLALYDAKESGRNTVKKN